MTTFAAQSRFPTWRGHVPWRQRAKDSLEALKELHPYLAAEIEGNPFARFEAIAHATPPRSYRRFSPELAQYLAGIREDLRSPYLCALLLSLMEGFEERFAQSGVHPEFALHYADGFNRIIDQINADPSFAALEKEAFMKDLWIARVVMIPAVAQVWWPHAGLPRRDLLRAGPGALAHCYLRSYGSRPFFEGHTHTPMLRQKYFSADGWIESLRLMALALPAFRKHKGVFSTAWFFDPSLGTVTPGLTFAADLQVARGAYRYRVGPSEDARTLATATSSSRRQKVADGTYVPTSFTVMWSRADLLYAYGPQRFEVPSEGIVWPARKANVG